MIEYEWETVQRDVQGQPSMMTCDAEQHVTLYLVAPGRPNSGSARVAHGYRAAPGRRQARQAVRPSGNRGPAGLERHAGQSGPGSQGRPAPDVPGSVTDPGRLLGRK